MPRRIDDRIRELCKEVLSEQDPAKVRQLLSQLQDSLHEHIERLRTNVAAYPLVKERRRD